MPPPQADRPPVFLVGFMCSGKTSVGRALARLGGHRFVDTDELVVDRAARPIERIVETSGEEELRRIEAEVLEALAEIRGVVVATGGGAFLLHRTRRWMRRAGTTVWLDIPLALAEARRLSDPTPRPLWPGESKLALRAFFEKRRALYSLAELRVDASGSPEEVARVIERGLSAPKTRIFR